MYLISQPHDPGPESCLRFVPLWQTVETTFGRATGLPWRWRDWAYWLENVRAKSCSTRPRVVSGVQPAIATDTAARRASIPRRRRRCAVIVDQPPATSRRRNATKAIAVATVRYTPATTRPRISGAAYEGLSSSPRHADIVKPRSTWRTVSHALRNV